jgi:hypothetical protein
MSFVLASSMTSSVVLTTQSLAPGAEPPAALDGFTAT